MTEPLTQKQQHLLNYIRETVAKEGHPPSLRTAAAALNISHATVAQGLKALEEKGVLKRSGRYSRTIHLINSFRETDVLQRWIEVPVIGQIKAGLPMYAQQEWAGSMVLDSEVYRGQNLFALQIKGDSMKDAGMLDGDMAICEPRQYAKDREIVVALVHNEEATVKRFFLHSDHIELRPENPNYTPMNYGFDEVLIQGKVIGIQRGPDVMGNV